MELFKPGIQIDFMKQRRFWITLSIALVIISTILTFYPGPNYGTDFRGGTEIELDFKKDIDPSLVRSTVETSGFSGVDVVQVRDEKHMNRFILRVQDVSVLSEGTLGLVRTALCLPDANGKTDEAKCPIDSPRATEVKFSAGGDKVAARYDSAPDLKKIKAQMASVPGVILRESASNPMMTNARDHRVEIQLQSKGDQLLKALADKLGADMVPEQALRTEWVGPKAGKQLRDNARNSVVIAIVFIMFYLAFRFDLRFAPGVVLACVHDAMVVIGAFVLLRKEVTLSTIAAVLTIVGYSMNDTIVVYDRIRENLSRYKGKTFAQVINMSVSETLSRTILTSTLTAMSVIPFFYWGTGVIRDFALAMVIGIVAGTYSSIYVAAPLTEWIDSKLVEAQKKSAAAAGSTARAT